MNLFFLQQNDKNEGNGKISTDIDKKIIREQVDDFQKKKEEIAKIAKSMDDSESKEDQSNPLSQDKSSGE